MSLVINWLVLLIFSGAGVYIAQWVVSQSYERWKGPANPASIGFLYALIIASVIGFSYIGALVVYNKILVDSAFLEFTGAGGVIKFLLVFSGVWYALVYAWPSRHGLGRK
ncbi:MAG: hypothetical protein GXP05_14055 [Alphaproteobacteria bacterium]|nr:hypothetical protein [Alphaproteobacteria bacterium]